MNKRASEREWVLNACRQHCRCRRLHKVPRRKTNESVAFAVPCQGMATKTKTTTTANRCVFCALQCIIIIIQCSKAMIQPFNLTRLTSNWIKLNPYDGEFNGQQIYSIWVVFTFASKPSIYKYLSLSLSVCACVSISVVLIRSKRLFAFWFPSHCESAELMLMLLFLSMSMMTMMPYFVLCRAAD